jgi:hypothetical protein
VCWPAASSGSPASDFPFDPGEIVASLTPTPRLLIALHPSLDWTQEWLDYRAQLGRLVPCPFTDDRLGKSSGIVQFLRQGGRPLSNHSALHSDHYHGAFYSAKSEWHVQSTILTPTVDDQTLDRQVDFAELGVIHSITIAAILPTTRHERG